MTNHMIETTGLRRVFRSRGTEVEAVAGVDLSVRQGEVFGFLGPNGAGKTTTMRMLVTLLPPSGGTATVAGFDLLRAAGDVRRRIGYVAQGGGSDPSETGRSELVHQGRVFGMTRADARTRAAELVERFQLDDCADRRTSTWSGGQRRRLDIAIGLVHRPVLVFLDEPTTGLDPQSRANLWDEVRTLRADGTTVFLTTHYLDEADALCDRLAIIDHGRIVAEGSPDELKRRIAGDVVTIGIDHAGGDPAEALALLRDQPFVREASGDDGVLRLYVDRGETATPAILRLLDEAGMPPSSLTLTRPSLDDVFLQQTGRSLRDAA
ncbi:MAG TPA: ATP-binding cassette domain-containing protein [Acidimicrobiales bacterium]|jgi:ABC-2 type transport system ATP-binding protein|nr:ATP-binding cassette domain-containing protein [Acidimicrobiales bacterium]